MIGIVDLVALCDDEYAANLGWFVVLGRRVADEPVPALQQLWATAAHRHAWHAELWARRRPAIPHDAIHALPEPATIEVAGGDLRAAYRDHLAHELEALARLRAGTDAELDPSTHRVAGLIATDLRDLSERLTAIA